MFEKHGLTGTTKKVVFNALLERQQGQCFICHSSQVELEARSHEQAVVWAKARKKEQEEGEFRSDGFQQWLADHEDFAKQYEKRREIERTLSQEELAVWRQKRDATHSTLHIDHCHTTGMIRGLLCSECNYFLGVVENAGLLHNYLAPAFLYKPLTWKQEKILDWFHWHGEDDWFERNKDTILLYMQNERWLPCKDILVHLAGEIKELSENLHFHEKR